MKLVSKILDRLATVISKLPDGGMGFPSIHPKFVIEFFDDPHAAGKGEVVIMENGEPPAVGEFIARINDGKPRELHRVSKILHIARGETLYPWLVCPKVDDRYHLEISDVYADFIVIFEDHRRKEIGTIEAKNSRFPAIGEQIVYKDSSFTVKEVYSCAFEHKIHPAVVAVKDAPKNPSTSRKRIKKKAN